MLKNIPKQEAQLINLLNNQLKGLFLENILAFYVIGSLARGGYSRECSDIDLLVVLKSSMVDLYLEKIDMFYELISSTESPLADKISLFNGTIDSFNSGDERIRLPAYDKQDLKAHGVLISGHDIRKDILAPFIALFLVLRGKPFEESFRLRSRHYIWMDFLLESQAEF